MVVLGLAAAGLFIWNRQMKKATVTPILGTVDAFSLTDQAGQTITRDALKGKFWVASFIFTQCHGPCPLITTKAVEVQKSITNPNLVFVALSVDPDHDTPEALAKYAALYGADSSRWHFLTGKKSEIFSLIRSSFHLAVEDADNKNPNDILHSTMLVAVGPQGDVRGYYNSTDNAAVQKLRDDLTKWLND